MKARFRWLALWAIIAPITAVAQSPKDRPTTETPNCTTGGCHAEVKNFPVVHGPLAADACAGCHTPADTAKHTFSLARSGNDICLFCHEPQKGSIMHKPITTGTCLDCHQPHGGKTRAFLKADTVAQNCATCHKDVTGGHSVVHGPVAAGGCTACHNPHASNVPKLLLKEPKQLCLECHVSSAQRMETCTVKHDPAEKNCLLCHDAHASNEKMILKQPAQQLCLSCHEKIKSTVQHAKTQHGAVVEGRACLNCHDAHATNFPRVLKNNPMALCMECHNKALDSPTGKIADMSMVLATGKSLHGPIAEKNCSACHQIHGSDTFRLLTKEYPPEFYAPFNAESYALCFSCHEKSLVLEAKTTALTGFRNGDENLHFVHVNRDTKGRTCRACHETHASDQAKHIRDSVPFGKWNMPIRFQKTDTGGGCAPGCHVPYQYDRVRPVTYANTPGQKPPTWPAENSGGAQQ